LIGKSSEDIKGFFLPNSIKNEEFWHNSPSLLSYYTDFWSYLRNFCCWYHI